jgi:hypothetical protein
MPDLLPISKEEKIACLEREITQRRGVYPRLIAAKKMSQEFAAKQIEVMQAILADYQQGRVQ